MKAGRSYLEEPVRAISAPSIIPPRNCHFPPSFYVSHAIPHLRAASPVPSLLFRSPHDILVGGGELVNRQLHITSPSTLDWDHEASSVRWNPRRVSASGNPTCRAAPLVSLDGVTGRSGLTPLCLVFCVATATMRARFKTGACTYRRRS